MLRLLYRVLALTLLATTTAYSQTSQPDPTPVHISIRKARLLAAAQDSAAILPQVRMEANEWRTAYQAADTARMASDAQIAALRKGYNSCQAAIAQKNIEVIMANMQATLWKQTARRRSRRLVGLIGTVVAGAAGFLYLSHR